VLSQCSREVEIVRPQNATPLVVPTRRQPKVEAPTPWKALEIDVVATVEFGAVRSNRVDLVRGVRLYDLLLVATTSAIAPNQYDVLEQNGPFALHPDQASA